MHTASAHLPSAKGKYRRLCCGWRQGRDGTHGTTWALKAAKDILTESFDPIVDVAGQDLLELMVGAQVSPPWDYSGMHTAILRYRVSHFPLASLTVEHSEFVQLQCTGKPVVWKAY